MSSLMCAALLVETCCVVCSPVQGADIFGMMPGFSNKTLSPTLHAHRILLRFSCAFDLFAMSCFHCAMRAQSVHIDTGRTMSHPNVIWPGEACNVA